MIILKNLSRIYDVGSQPLYALKDLNLEVAAGEYLAVMGPSGSGKSSLLNILGCLDTPSTGEYYLDGKEVAGLSEDELAKVRMFKIGFVFQSFHLISRLSALENVKVPMILGGLSSKEADERARQALARVGLEKRGSHRPNQMSGGEKQRVAIARALIMDPPIILADEPTGNLDTQSGKGVVSILEDMVAAGKTLIVVTHDPEMGKRAKRLLRIVDGQFALDQRQD